MGKFLDLENGQKKPSENKIGKKAGMIFFFILTKKNRIFYIGLLKKIMSFYEFIGESFIFVEI